MRDVVTYLLNRAIQILVGVKLGEIFDINTQLCCKHWKRFYGRVRVQFGEILQQNLACLSCPGGATAANTSYASGNKPFGGCFLHP